MPLASVGLQTPPVCGVPPKEANKSCELPLLQVLKLPFVPAFGKGLTVTVALAVPLAHGEVPVTV